MLKKIYVFIMRNRIILRHEWRSSRKKRVNLHWTGKVNLGDYLSVVVFDYMTARENINQDKKISKTKHLYAVGSIIGFGFQNATIWGSGILSLPASFGNRQKYNHFLRKLDIRLVRGPQTREFLIKKGYRCPEKYGDPAVLMPLIYTPQKAEIKKDYMVVLHKDTYIENENAVSMATTDYKAFIDKIANSKKVISSSLHGIILAEVYGVPAVLLEDTPTRESMFKFDDYYRSTKRFDYPVAKSIEEAVKITPPPLPDNFDEMRKDLSESFPYDLWE